MNLLKSLIKISSITMLSRILGFIRDVIIARTFGVSIMTDAFFIAFKLPNVLRRVFAEGVFFQIFLPILSKYKYHNTTRDIKIFVARVFGMLMMILIVIVVFGLITAPWIIMIAVPGFHNSTEKFYMTIAAFRIMFPYILLISLVSLMAAILNVWNFLLVPAFSPIFLNISMIGFMIFSEHLYCHPSIIGLSWAVMIGGLIQFIYCLPFLKKINMLVIPKIFFFDNTICQMCRRMGPALIAVSGSQISLLINTVLASFLTDGSISWMYYADRLIELPMGVFGVALTTILLPYLSRFAAMNNDKDYFDLMNWSIKLCCILSLPSAVILGVLSEPIIITLFQYGKFSEFDVLMTQYSVIAYSVGLPGLILVKVLTAGFYARCDVKTPVRVIVMIIVFTQFINLVCIHFLKHVVFAVAISLGAWMHAGILYWNFQKKYLFQLSSGWLLFCFQLGVALLVTYVVCMGFLELISDWDKGNIMYRLYKVIGALTASISSYFVTLWMVGIRMKDFSFVNKKY